MTRQGTLELDPADDHSSPFRDEGDETDDEERAGIDPSDASLARFGVSGQDALAGVGNGD
jgi:hypothetical protein